MESYTIDTELLYSVLMKKIREAGGDISGLTADVEELQEKVAQLANALVNLGVTTTPLSDGITTNPIMINGESVMVPNNGFVAYGSKEFLFNGTIWQELGDVTDVYSKNESDARYVQKETGKGLSTNDYTNSDKAAVQDIVTSKTVSGSSVTITDSAPLSAKEVIIKINPIVTRNDTPAIYGTSQTDRNSLEIAGWNSITVTINGVDKVIDFPATIYEGTLNLTTGVLTSTRVVEEMTTLTGWSSASAMVYRNVSSIISESYDYQAGTGSTSFISSDFIVWYRKNKQVNLFVGMGVSASNYPQKVAQQQSQYNHTPWISYKVVNPTEYQLDPVEVILTGNDTISANCGDISVTYQPNNTIGEVWTVIKAINWIGTQAQYEALTPAQKVYEMYNITEDEDEEEPANTVSLQSLSPLTLDRTALTLDADYPEEEVNENADTDI